MARHLVAQWLVVRLLVVRWLVVQWLVALRPAALWPAEGWLLPHLFAKGLNRSWTPTDSRQVLSNVPTVLRIESLPSNARPLLELRPATPM